jgi:lipopolysaccharide transport system permease protein
MRRDSGGVPDEPSDDRPTAAREEVLVIRPPSGLSWLVPRDLWPYRELLYFLIWRDVKVRYKQTVLGAAWAILQPLLLTVVFAIFLGHLAHVPSEGAPYAVFAFTALVPWTLFSQALLGSTDSLLGSANLVTKVYFPRVLLPVASALSYTVDFAASLILLIGMMILYHVHIGWSLLLAPAFAGLALFASLSVGIWMSALNVRYRDVRYAVPFMVQLWLFLSPVAYPASLVPQRFRVLYGLNPMAGAVEGFRWSLLHTEQVPGMLVGASALATVAVFVVGLGYFHTVERGFADVI